MRMLVFSDIFRQDSRSVLLPSRFGRIIAQLEKGWVKLDVTFNFSRISPPEFWLEISVMAIFVSLVPKRRHISNKFY